MRKSEPRPGQFEESMTRTDYIKEAGKILLGVKLALEAKDIHKGTEKFNPAVDLMSALFALLRQGKITLENIGTSKEELEKMLFQSVTQTPQERDELLSLIDKQIKLAGKRRLPV